MRNLRQDLEDYHRYMDERSLKVIDLAVNSLPHTIERAINAEAEVERLRMALDKIAHPLKYMQMEARAKGRELNGIYSIMLSKDPRYLQEIALAELREDSEI